MMTIKDRRLVLPSGMSYRLLILPQSGIMTPALLDKDSRSGSETERRLLGPTFQDRQALSDILSATIR